MAALTLILAWVMAPAAMAGMVISRLVGVGTTGGHASGGPALVAWGIGMGACGVLWRRT